MAAAVAAAVVLSISGSVSPVRAAELNSSADAAAHIASTYGVEVLRVRALEMDGRQVYAVTVMTPGGNFNGAFAVSTLLVDAATGDLIPAFRHRASGYDLPGAGTYGSMDSAGGLTLRRRSLGP